MFRKKRWDSSDRQSLFTRPASVTADAWKRFSFTATRVAASVEAAELLHVNQVSVLHGAKFTHDPADLPFWINHSISRHPSKHVPLTNFTIDYAYVSNAMAVTWTADDRRHGLPFYRGLIILNKGEPVFSFFMETPRDMSQSYLPSMKVMKKEIPADIRRDYHERSYRHAIGYGEILMQQLKDGFCDPEQALSVAHKKFGTPAYLREVSCPHRAVRHMFRRMRDMHYDQ